MSKTETAIIKDIKLTKLVHGGQCLGDTPDGKKVFVWGGLPGELVDVRVIKKKSRYLEGIVDCIHTPSPDRIEPKEPEVYLSTSPWQIMRFSAENTAKQAILAEAFEREGVDSISWGDFYASDMDFGYRNKLEIGFWGDDQGIHLANYIRGTHGKHIISSNALATNAINSVALSFISALRDYAPKIECRAGDLKTVVIRSSQAGEVVSALFVKRKLDFSAFELPKGLKGLVVYYSDPKSPASIPTKKLYTKGDITLTDNVGTKDITYDVLSFFQVNLPVFEQTLKVIKSTIISKPKAKKHPIVDMYSGVGTIGLALGADVLVESDESNIVMAKKNTEGTSVEVIHATSESALKHIKSDSIIIVDPPRAGLHRDVIDRILEAKPSKIVYLSCNPSTQARDVKYLSEFYKISLAQGYNFFPRTPHIESLVVLTLS